MPYIIVAVLMYTSYQIIIIVSPAYSFVIESWPVQLGLEPTEPEHMHDSGQG